MRALKQKEQPGGAALWNETNMKNYISRNIFSIARLSQIIFT